MSVHRHLLGCCGCDWAASADLGVYFGTVMYSKECGGDYDSLDPGRGLLTPEPQVGGWDWMGGWMGFWGHVSRRVICGTGRVQDALCTVLTVLTVLTELKTTQSTSAQTVLVLQLSQQIFSYDDNKHHKHGKRIAVERSRLYQYRRSSHRLKAGDW